MWCAALSLLLAPAAHAHVPHDVITAAAPAPGLDRATVWWLVADHDEASDLYRSDDGGRTWQATHGDCLRDRLTAAAVLADGTTVLLGDGRTWWSDGDGGWTPRDLGFAPVAMAGGERLWLADEAEVWTQAADGGLSPAGLEASVVSLHAAASGVVALLADGSVAWSDAHGWQVVDGPPGALSATADDLGPFVGTTAGAVWRWEGDAWAPCGESPYLDWNPAHAQVVALATDGASLALAHADVGPALSEDRCATWTGAAAPLEIRWPEDEYDDGYQCWTTLDEAFTALAVAGGDAFVAGYDGPATLRDDIWSHPPLKGPDYTRGIGFSTSFSDDGAAMAAVYGCAFARSEDAGASWTCAPLGPTLPAAQDVDVPPDAAGLVPAFGLADRIPVRSGDGGRTWTALEGPWTKVWSLTAGAGERLWATNVHAADGEDPPGSALLSPDGGATWEEIEAFSALGDAVVVGLVDAGEVVAAWTGTPEPVSAPSQIALSWDGGATFTVDHEVPSGARGLALWPPHDPTRVLVASPDGLEVRDEAGWSAASLPEEVALRRVVVASDGTALAATRTQRLFVSADGGSTWADLGAQLEGQIEHLATHPDFARHPIALASGPAGSFQVDADGIVSRWMGLQRVDDDTEWVVCDPACLEEPRDDAGLGEVRRVPAGTAVEAWLRGTSARAIGAVEGSATVALEVDGAALGAKEIADLAFPDVLAEADGLGPGLHLVTLRVTAGDGVILDAFEATEPTEPLPGVSGPADTGLDDGGCGCAAGRNAPWWLTLVPLLARRRGRRSRGAPSSLTQWEGSRGPGGRT